MSDTNENLDRLNYYNGRRLDAPDLRMEQEYHMQVRRKLYKALYTWGIAEGLTVTPNPENRSEAIVSPGVALDFEGREIILLEEEHKPLPAVPPAQKLVGVVPKNQAAVSRTYLAIRYHEEHAGRANDGCGHLPSVSARGGREAGFGIPAYIRPTPRLEWRDALPRPESGLVVLAEVELDELCQIVSVNEYVRKYVMRVSSVRAFAIEGEADIDKDNPKELFFWIEGDNPNSVKLALRSLKFSSLYYTELGNHRHPHNIVVSNDHLRHNHAGKTDVSKHTHSSLIDHDDWPDDNTKRGRTVLNLDELIPIFGLDELEDQIWRLGLIGKDQQFNNPEAPLELQNEDDDLRLGPLGLRDASLMTHGHSHHISNWPPDTDPGNVSAGGEIDYAGQNVIARDGVAFTFLTSLQVEIRRMDIDSDFTLLNSQIIEWLNRRDVPNVWSKLGDGTGDTNTPPTDLFYSRGTGLVDLLDLGLDFPPGEYCLKFSVDDIFDPQGNLIKKNGGKVHYNLYIE